MKVEPLTDNAKRYELLQTVFLGSEEQPAHQFRVSRVQFTHKQVLLSLEGIENYEAADRWRNHYVHIPASEIMPKAEGEYYYFELAGLAVYTVSGAFVGGYTMWFLIRPEICSLYLPMTIGRS